MALSNFLAELFGVTVVIVSLAMLMNQDKVKKIVQMVEDEGAMILNGICSTLAGTAMVISHNIWARDWRVIITIIGWLILVRGVLCLFAPEIIKKWANRLKDTQISSIVFVAGVIIGCILLYLGYTA